MEEQLAFNNSYQSVEAALHGLGLAYVPEDVALTYIAKGRLRRPSRRQSSPAFVALVDVLRHRS